MDIKSSVGRIGESRATKAALLATLVAIVLVAGYRTLTEFPAPDPATYQAVFLANGQAYFGKLSNAGIGYILLKDVHYLVANPQSNDASEAERARKSQLVKLGSEVHEPLPYMYIPKRQILFWENLNPASRVMQGIGSQP